MVRETGKLFESVMRTVPLRLRIGSCASILWLKLCGTGAAPSSLSGPSGGGTGALKI